MREVRRRAVLAVGVEGVAAGEDGRKLQWSVDGESWGELCQPGGGDSCEEDAGAAAELAGRSVVVADLTGADALALLPRNPRFIVRWVVGLQKQRAGGVEEQLVALVSSC